MWPILIKNCWHGRWSPYATWSTLMWPIFSIFFKIFMNFYYLLSTFFSFLFFVFFSTLAGDLFGHKRGPATLTWSGREANTLASQSCKKTMKIRKRKKNKKVIENSENFKNYQISASYAMQETGIHINDFRPKLVSHRRKIKN